MQEAKKKIQVKGNLSRATMKTLQGISDGGTSKTKGGFDDMNNVAAQVLLNLTRCVMYRVSVMMQLHAI